MTKTIKALLHPRGVWSSTYEGGYDRYAVVYADENKTSVYCSLADDNTLPLSDEESWMCFSNLEGIKQYIDEQILDHTSDLLKEKVTIQVDFDEAPDEYEVNIQILDSGNNVVAEATNLLVYLFMPKTKYKVRTTTLIDGYSNPAVLEFTALSGYDRTVKMTYKKVVAGVYIQTVDHILVEADNFDADTMTANGIYVGSGSNALIVSLKNLGSMAWATSGTYEFSNWLAGVYADQGSGDMKGKQNTDGLINTCDLNKMPALKAIVNQEWPDGTSQGYMPSIGELVMCKNNLDAISYAISKIYGAQSWTLQSGNWWSSSLSSTSFAWGLGNGSPGSYNKSIGILVRAVAAP